MAKKRVIVDATFGELAHVVSNLWRRPLQMKMFGREWTVSLSVDIDPEDGVEENQRLAYEHFCEHTSKVAALSEKAIYHYYRGVCKEYRGRFGIQVPDDRRVPLIKSVKEVFMLVELEAVTFPYVRPRPTFGVLCECTWEKEHGLAVKFEDGKVANVGFQDIVL